MSQCVRDNYDGETARDNVAYECYEPIAASMLALIVSLSVLGTLAVIGVTFYFLVFHNKKPKFCKKKWKRGDVVPDEEIDADIVPSNWLGESFYNMGTYQMPGGGYHPVGTYVVVDVSAKGDFFFCELVNDAAEKQVLEFGVAYVVNRVKAYKRDR